MTACSLLRLLLLRIPYLAAPYTCNCKIRSFTGYSEITESKITMFAHFYEYQRNFETVSRKKQLTLLSQPQRWKFHVVVWPPKWKKPPQKACRTWSAIIFPRSTNQIIDPKTSELYPREAKPPVFFHQIRSPTAEKILFSTPGSPLNYYNPSHYFTQVWIYHCLQYISRSKYFLFVFTITKNLQ